MGGILIKRGEREAAIPYLRQAFDAVSKDAPAQYAFAAGSLADALQKTGSLDEAEHFNQIALQYVNPQKKKDLAAFNGTQAAIAERRGQRDQAISLYTVRTLNIPRNTLGFMANARGIGAYLCGGRRNFQARPMRAIAKRSLLSRQIARTNSNPITRSLFFQTSFASIRITLLC